MNQYRSTGYRLLLDPNRAPKRRREPSRAPGKADEKEGPNV